MVRTKWPGAFTLCLFGIAVLAIQFMGSSDAYAYQKGKIHNVVYFNPDVTVEDPIAAVSAMKPFTDYLGKKLGVDFRPYFFKRKSDLEHFLKSNKVSFGIYSQLYIVENHVSQNFYPIVICLKEGQPYYRKVVLVRKDSPYKSLQDLKGKTLATTALGADNIPFLNKVVFREEIDVTSHFGKINTVDSANSAIMALLYKQVDAAATNYLNFIFMKELNPQVGIQLKSIFTSGKTPLPGLVVYRDQVEADLVKRCIEEMEVMHLSPTGSQAMMAFQVDAWKQCSIHDWAETAELLGISLETGKMLASASAPTTTSSSSEKQEGGSSKMASTRSEISPKVRFGMIQAIDDSEANEVRVTASLIVPPGSTKVTKVMLSYIFSTGKKGAVQLFQKKRMQYEGAIPLPKLASQGDREKIEYTVKPGDTLGKIAKKFLGSSKKYMQIATLNQLKNPNLIFVDQKLTIMSGEFTGLDIDYRLTAQDVQGKMYLSPKKFFSVIR